MRKFECLYLNLKTDSCKKIVGLDGLWQDMMVCMNLRIIGL